MKQNEVFGAAKWVCAGEYTVKDTMIPEPKGTSRFPILRAGIGIDGKIRKATLRVVGLGFFTAYINGKRISDDYYLPLSTDYEERANVPSGEKLTGHRLYVPEYDVTGFLSEGKNVLSVFFGGGWYTHHDAFYGTAKAIYRLTVETDSGVKEFYSSENDRIHGSHLTAYNILNRETQDFRLYEDGWFEKDYDDSGWENCKLAPPVDTSYLFTDCPPDRVCETLSVRKTGQKGDFISYDCGRNISGYPVVTIKGKSGDPIEIDFAEELGEDGTIDGASTWQTFVIYCDGTERTVVPMFTWFAFRYFAIAGDAEVIEVKYVHTDVKKASSFESDNETLNWLYQAFVTTQYNNMHAGIPSDCPHLERKGYTGDGQLCCHAVMNTLDAEAFYRKWIGDISDCQDLISGHVQHTAPYCSCGGGPGGWGGAVVEVPYRFYKHYGDTEIIGKIYPQMLRYFDYLDAHSENDLVTSEKEGEWCLGDWCAVEAIKIPEPYVNTCLYVKWLDRAMEVAKVTGHGDDIPMLAEKKKRKMAAIEREYLKDGGYFDGVQAADAFAVDIGLGGDELYRRLAARYENLGAYDTGIIGTEIITRLFFENGDAELAVRLLTSEDPNSFHEMMARGGTTLWENWPAAVWQRSHDHPMFGAVTAYLFDYLLGIKDAGDCGYRNIVISPSIVSNVNRIRGSRKLPLGEVSVGYEKDGGEIRFSVTIPQDINAEFVLGDVKIALKSGENSFTVRM